MLKRNNKPVEKEQIVKEVRADFERRGRDRLAFEAQWQLNTNFVLGNQYCYATRDGRVEPDEREYYWQEREVFNHIAPIVETRLAKLGRVRPKMSVRPASGDEDDLRTGKAASKILDAACRKLELSELIGRATMWSELTGSVFYKVVWDDCAGEKLRDDEQLFSGDVSISVCPPYEIYPDALTHQTVDECASIIHAKAALCSEIKRVWGKDVVPESADIMTMNTVSMIGGLNNFSALPSIGRETSNAHCMVIERYTRPTAELPDGELVIIAGGELLHYGPLPYVNGVDGRRDLPFVKQDALTHAGCFFGTSMVERTIPIQRAFNAVKNRKHEFMNRIAMGVLAVEDGSVDTANLEEEGLSPGKILVYRMGSSPPVLLDPGRVPSDFSSEEDRLLNEFISVSGVSEIMRSSTVPTTVSSGVALQLLIEQDDTRLAMTADHVRDAVRRVGQHVLRLYKQFASQPRLMKYVGDEGDVELMSFTASDIGCDDVIFDTENELSSTPATKQTMMFELIRMGLLSDSNGNLSEAMRHKILDTIGYGGWEITQDLTSLQCAAAQRENLHAAEREPQIGELDDHDVHISEHTKFVLASEAGESGKSSRARERMLKHIRLHKAANNVAAAIQEVTDEKSEVS